MHASIRSYEYEGTPMATDELVQLGREIGTTLSHAPGFVSFLIISSVPQSQGPTTEQNQVLATVSIFEDQPSLEQVDRSLAAPLEQHVAPWCPKRVKITSGQIVFQRGL